MKYLTLALVALLFNFGIAVKVPKNNFKSSNTEDVVIQETSAESDLDDNAVDSDNPVLNNVVTSVVNDDSSSDTVNLLDSTHKAPDATVYQNNPAKTLAVSSINHVTKSVGPIQTLNAVKGQARVTKKSFVTHNQSPQHTVPQQVFYTQTQQPLLVKYLSSVPEQQILYNVQQPHHQQQFVYSVPEQQQTVYSQVQPQQQWATFQQKPQQQFVYSQVQPQHQLFTLQQQSAQKAVQTPQHQLTLVKTKSTQQPTVVHKQVWLQDQSPVSKTSAQLQPVRHVSKTAKDANPIVLQLNASKQTLNKQTTLTGSQLVSDASDLSESSKPDVIVQEAESNF